MADQQHRATPWQWETIERNHHHAEFSCILELHDRVEALEASQRGGIDLSHLSDAEREKLLKSIANPGRFEMLEATQFEHLIDPEKEKMAQKVMQAAGFAPLPLSSEAELRAATRLHSYKVGKAEPVENWGEGHTLVQPPVYAAEAKPTHPEIPDSSLVKRVACAIYPDGSQLAQARAAIREVAAWLRKESEGYLGSGLHWAKRLEQEAKR